MKKLVFVDVSSTCTAGDSTQMHKCYFSLHDHPCFVVSDAAIGACSYLASKNSIVKGGINLQPFSSSATSTVSFLTAGDRIRYDALVTRNEVQLMMHQQHTEAECNNKSFTIVDFLSELGLDKSDVLSENANDWPLFLNSSVARPKTLIPISSIQRLHAATPPRNAEKFRDMCDSIESTGVYLYSPVPTTEIGTATTKKKVDIEFECRQFPRWSGYSEDPATGIAAGALAASLHKRQHSRCGSGESCHICYQGTAMGRPSKIQVAISDYASSSSVCPTLKVTYTGLVVFDTVSV